MLGLETALAVTITELVEPGILSLSDALALAVLASCGDRRVGRPGRTDRRRARRRTSRVFDPGHEWEVEPERLASRARNTPFAGRTLKGGCVTPSCAGNRSCIDGEATR